MDIKKNLREGIEDNTERIIATIKQIRSFGEIPLTVDNIMVASLFQSGGTYTKEEIINVIEKYNIKL